MSPTTPLRLASSESPTSFDRSGWSRPSECAIVTLARAGSTLGQRLADGEIAGSIAQGARCLPTSAPPTASPAIPPSATACQSAWRSSPPSLPIIDAGVDRDGNQIIRQSRWRASALPEKERKGQGAEGSRLAGRGKHTAKTNDPVPVPDRARRRRAPGPRVCTPRLAGRR